MVMLAMMALLVFLLLMIIGLAGSVAARPFDGIPSLKDSSDDLPSQPYTPPRGNLVHVQLLHRHGDRAPVHVAPAHAERWAAQGLRPGQLSPIGAQQLAALGRFMRKHYVQEASFLPDVAGHSLSVRSTDVDRCLQSVHALLDELYPNTMIPVHTMPEEHEKLLQPTDKCPSYLVAYRGILGELDEVLTKQMAADPTDRQAKSLLSTLASESGYGSQLQAASLVTIVTDNIVYFHKFTPLHIRRAWARSQGAKNGITLADEALTTTQGEGATEEIDPRGSIGGVLVRHIVHHWDNVLSAQRSMLQSSSSLHARQQEEAETEVVSLTPAFDQPGDNERRMEERRRGQRGLPRTLLSHEAESDQLSTIDESSASRVLLADRPRPHKTPSLSDPAVAPLSAPSTISRLLARPRKRTRAKSTGPSSSVGRLAGEMLQIYSAHDSTIIALMESLGLITSPESEFLLPPYGASVTLELRSTVPSSARRSSNNAGEGLMVNAYYGFPRASVVGSDGFPAPQAEWVYHRHPLALRCPEAGGGGEEGWRARKAWQCSLESFRKYILLSARSSSASSSMSSAHSSGGGNLLARTGAATLGISQAYAPEDGCCVRTPAFLALGCDSTASPASLTSSSHAPELESECVAFRQRCPATACAEGHVLDPASLACVAVRVQTTQGGVLVDKALSIAEAAAAAGVDAADRPLIDAPINSGGEAAVLPLEPVTLPMARSNLDFSCLLFGACCVALGFALGLCWVRQPCRALGGRGKDVARYGLMKLLRRSAPQQQQDSGDESSSSDKDALLSGQRAGKRKPSPQLVANSLP